ncbi:capK domain protein [Brucella endophytica]|uniref:CapK domain protein n=1 Tax=Brucella endophytica TaxID=1963359 RepID=A0A916WKT3_9HYPH|nr:phenylacetate--CoA ligase family protein [Brucella endophytica]GGB11288.1 capK domain protein [Brucella endophytica]
MVINPFASWTLSDTPPGAVYDTQAHHHDLPGIRRLAALNEPSQADTAMMQMAALSYWQQHGAALLAAPFEDPERVRARQFAQLQALADYAFQHVPFYRNLYGSVGFSPGALRTWADFNALPMINKRMLAAAPDKARLVLGAHLDACYSSRSSGSSGTPLTTWLDSQDVIRDFAEQLRFLHDASDGHLRGDDWIYTLHHGGFWYSSALGQYRVFRLMDLQKTDLSDLAHHLQLLQPVVLTTLPSYLPVLAELGPLTRFGVRALTTNSEMSSPAERQRYSRHLGVPVLDEYSSEEIGLMATECLHGSYHVIEDGVYLEIVDADSDGLGHVVVSDLGNVLMPLIRYDHGDLAKFSSNSCTCGRQFRRLSTLHGRCDDAFQTATGKYLPSASVLAICDDLLTDEKSGMREYRLIQHGMSEVELQYSGVPSSTDVSQTIAELQRRLEDLFGYQLQLCVTQFDVLPQSASFKRRCLLRMWSKSP